MREAGIPYTCLIGDEDTLKQVPGFKGFPTTLVLDRQGRVRVLVTENNANTMDFIADVVRVLLAESVAKPAVPKPGPAAKDSAPKPDATTKKAAPQPDATAKDSVPKSDAVGQNPKP